MGLTHPDILTNERFGSRDFGDVEIHICAHCKEPASVEYEDICTDFAGQYFCCEDCFKDFYGFRSVCG